MAVLGRIQKQMASIIGSGINGNNVIELDLVRCGD